MYRARAPTQPVKSWHVSKADVKMHVRDVMFLLSFSRHFHKGFEKLIGRCAASYEAGKTSC